RFAERGRYFVDWFRSLFGAPTGAHRSSARPSLTSHPAMEQLEERKVMSVTYQGGPIIQHVQVDTVYYGQDWVTADNQANAQQLNQFFADVTNSSYLGMLGEYGVGLGSFEKSDFVTDASSPTAGTTVTEAQIQQMLTNEIDTGNLPTPDGNHLEFVYLPPNV